MTVVDAYDMENPVRLADPKLFKFPFVYALEVGWMGLTDSEARALRNYLLTWEPLFAEMATDGSLGFTYGDWSTSDRSTDSVTWSGRYLTVWKKHDGEWKVTTDIGNNAR